MIFNFFKPDNRVIPIAKKPLDDLIKPEQDRLDKLGSTKETKSKKVPPLDEIVKNDKKKSRNIPTNSLLKEPIPVDEYARHTELYKSFLSEYRKTIPTNNVNYLYLSSETAKEAETWAPEAITQKEREEYVRVVQMNNLMGGNHNHFDPGRKQAYEMWKYCSKFNELLSFMMYDRVLSA